MEERGLRIEIEELPLRARKLNPDELVAVFGGASGLVVPVLAPPLSTGNRAIVVLEDAAHAPLVLDMNAYDACFLYRREGEG